MGPQDIQDKTEIHTIPKSQEKYSNITGKLLENTSDSQILDYPVHLRLMRTQAIPNALGCTNSDAMKILCENQHYFQTLSFGEIWS